MQKRIVFLYTELAEYFLASIELLAKKNVDVCIVHWPVNPEAPFKLRVMPNVVFHNRSTLSRLQLQHIVGTFNPSVILCSGWVDRDYLSIVRKHHRKIPTVLLLDNHWLGNVRQVFAAMLSRFILKPIFSHAWVPGKQQYNYALKLGFRAGEIRRGYYCADVRTFHSWYNQFRDEKNASYPRRFLYAGRYLPFKGIFSLWETFVELHREFPDWELWCTGQGDLWDSRIHHPAIRHFGFVQPHALGEVIRYCGAFILPSLKEPWGVVVHEMTAAGMPVITTKVVGAASVFVKDGENGFVIAPADKKALSHAMRTIMSATDERLQQMSARSYELSDNITPDTWQETILSFIPSGYP